MATASVRTKTMKSGVRVRAAKPGETREQQEAWRDAMKARGIPSIVFSSQDRLNEFFAHVKAYEKREALRDKLEWQYLAGELVPNAKASKAVATA